jgi:RNA polymerase sigma-70 factor (ECF subfamily)
MMSATAKKGARRNFSEARDEVLVALTRQGNEQAFEELVRRYTRTAHSVAQSVVGSPDLADDVCQEAFLAALRNMEKCRQPGRFRAWLLTIARNRALNMIASESKKSIVSIDVAGEFSGPEDPHADLERKELRSKLHRLALKLSGMQERVFRLHEFEGWGHTEIATELGISYGASRVHLHLARKRLRVGLREKQLGIA